MQVALRVLEGRVITGGVTQDVRRSAGLTRILLTVMPGHPAGALREGETGEIRFPQPVVIPPGESAEIIIEWASGGRECAGPAGFPCGGVLEAAHVRR